MCEWVCNIICYFFGSINQQMLEFTSSQWKKYNKTSTIKQLHLMILPFSFGIYMRVYSRLLCQYACLCVCVCVCVRVLSESNMPMKVFLFNFNHFSIIIERFTNEIESEKMNRNQKLIDADQTFFVVAVVVAFLLTFVYNLQFLI